eukprot:scaffold21928_cov32-Phaeocystis_antarctica.AAC.1
MALCIWLACRTALPRAASPLPRCGLREREREVRPSAFAFSPATCRWRTGPCRSLMSAPFCPASPRSLGGAPDASASSPGARRAPSGTSPARSLRPPSAPRSCRHSTCGR